MSASHGGEKEKQADSQSATETKPLSRAEMSPEQLKELKAAIQTSYVKHIRGVDLHAPETFALLEQLQARLLEDDAVQLPNIQVLMSILKYALYERDQKKDVLELLKKYIDHKITFEELVTREDQEPLILKYYNKGLSFFAAYDSEEKSQNMQFVGKIFEKTEQWKTTFDKFLAENKLQDMKAEQKTIVAKPLDAPDQIAKIIKNYRDAWQAEASEMTHLQSIWEAKDRSQVMQQKFVAMEKKYDEMLTEAYRAFSKSVVICKSNQAELLKNIGSKQPDEKIVTREVSGDGFVEKKTTAQTIRQEMIQQAKDLTNKIQIEWLGGMRAIEFSPEDRAVKQKKYAALHKEFEMLLDFVKDVFSIPAKGDQQKKMLEIINYVHETIMQNKFPFAPMLIDMAKSLDAASKAAASGMPPVPSLKKPFDNFASACQKIAGIEPTIPSVSPSVRLTGAGSPR